MFRGAFQPWHLLILVIVIVIVFGWKRLPDAARSLGRSARILKSEMDEMKSENGSSASKETVNGETVEESEARIKREDGQHRSAQAGHPDGYPQRPTDQNPSA
ncbi:Sec-independent protein translocase subunit TatA [Yimella sp. cx-51]|uniref:Sec-independent protein translocase subunit TatA n=1 Tax=Yimella sp. cx-51 TaxID=2770551 RepID=UPI00165D53E4|nr:Sec-independent protein translocase subunit TatA [Yimella sp. cx-51]MBC9957341.1 Sec-independent protein translocase subunit TatA [Yimella sp. cx-51]QTH39415.1 Sec-independent protein translocase subunit TatA [Yimella sp. cx-51]